MRIGIREQLGIIVLLASAISLIVLALAVWYNNYNFVRDIKGQDLRLTASLKSEQIASDLLLIQAVCSTIVTRVVLQAALRGALGNDTRYNFTDAQTDIQGALLSGGLSALLQAAVYPRNGSGQAISVLNATAVGPGIVLPNTFHSDGTPVNLGDPELGYPPMLYPNVTYQGDQPWAFNDYPLNASANLLLGPLQINASYALLSLTLPIIDTKDRSTILGFMTVVAAATSLMRVLQSREGLGETGLVLLVGPNRRENLFSYPYRPATLTYEPDAGAWEHVTVRYIFPPYPYGHQDRHAKFNANLTEYGSSNFTAEQFQPIVRGFTEKNDAINNASSMVSTHNENGAHVAVGLARVQSPNANWLVLIEQPHREAWEPIYRLRRIILACAFGTLGLIIILTIPLAHYGVAPIRRLREATDRSVAPPSFGGSSHSSLSDQSGDEEPDVDLGAVNGRSTSKISRKGGLLYRLKRLGRPSKSRGSPKLEKDPRDRRKEFKIPAKVEDRPHVIKDELTDLTSKFNEMTEELLYQYTSLEEKVRVRTQELELSKKAAEAANESKTLFIANISHELKTPLNGILGMCAVCMGEEDMAKIKHSLEIVYKSGDLLLNLLNDLLTFSKNQIGQQLSLEEREFRLSDIKEQLRSIFRKQAGEGNIDFTVQFLSMNGDATKSSEAISEKQLPAIGPAGIGRLKDLCLWGDQHRILQVLINLVSNSLKFTPVGGKVEVRIKCTGETEPFDGARNSMGSKQSSARHSRHRHRNGSGSSRNSSQTSQPAGTALTINPMDPKATPRVHVRERSPTPPPPGARTLMFEFAVEDTGPGISEQMQAQVFEPFVQGDLGLSRKYGGTGLGLSICSQLASLMGGSIELVSTVGVGSTFIMRIPLKFVKERAASTASSDVYGSRTASARVSDEIHRPGTVSGEATRATPPISTSNKSPAYPKDQQPRLVGLSQPYFAPTPSPSKKEPPREQLAALNQAAKDKRPAQKTRVLVAEDNLVNQEVVLRMLKLEDVYDVIIANNGQEAYDMVKESMETGLYFNLIFMDIQMPDLDGIQSTKLIRQMGYSAPIVALTAFSEESNVKDCYDCGMDHFLSKPIRRPALKQVLKKFAPIPEETEGGTLSENTSPVGSHVMPASPNGLKTAMPDTKSRNDSGKDVDHDDKTQALQISRPSEVNGAIGVQDEKT